MFTPLRCVHFTERHGFHSDGRRVGKHMAHQGAVTLRKPAVIGVMPTQMRRHHLGHGRDVALAGFLPRHDQQSCHFVLPLFAGVEGPEVLFLLIARRNG